MRREADRANLRTCEHCGHHFVVDESLAGKHGRCKNCGQETDVPAPGLRLEPLLAEDSSVSDNAARVATPSGHSPSASSSRSEAVERASVEKLNRGRSNTKDEAGDVKPYELDKDFEPPRSAVPSSSVPILMEARAGWRHNVRVLMGKLSRFEDVIYLVLMAFWLIGAVAFIFELKPLDWTMLGLLAVCSLLLLLLGGFEVFIKHFQESLRHGRPSYSSRPMRSIMSTRVGSR